MAKNSKGGKPNVSNEPAKNGKDSVNPVIPAKGEGSSNTNTVPIPIIPNPTITKNFERGGNSGGKTSSKNSGNQKGGGNKGQNSDSIGDSQQGGPFVPTKTPVVDEIVVKVRARNDDSVSSFAQSLNSLAVDRETKRKHVPIISIHTKVDVTGSEYSLLNQAFKNGTFELRQTPGWVTNATSSLEYYSSTFFEKYFQYVADTLAVRCIALNILHLYDDYFEGVFKEDPVMSKLLLGYFGNFIPRRKQFTNSIDLITKNLGRFYLPDKMVKYVEKVYKFTSLPHHGYEVLVMDSLYLSLPKDVLKGRNSTNEPCDTIFSFPFDEKIVNEGNTFNNYVKILMFFANRLEEDDSNGEFNDLHCIMKLVSSEWTVKPEPTDTYVYTHAQSNGRRIAALNVYVPSTVEGVSRNLTYNMKSNQRDYPDYKSSLNFIEYGGVKNPKFEPRLNTVIIDDSERGDLYKNDVSRVYSNPIVYHDTEGGFNLTELDLLDFNIPFKTLYQGYEEPRTDVINEPGLKYASLNNQGLSLIYGFVLDLVISSDNVVNDSQLLLLDEIVDYHAAIDCKTSFYYEVKPGERSLDDLKIFNPSKIGKMLYASNPAFRRVSLDMNSLRTTLYPYFLEIWTNENTLIEFKKRNSMDTRPELKLYKVQNISISDANI
jgi:hypothetical protein